MGQVHVVVFVACAIANFPVHPLKDLKFFHNTSAEDNVQVLNCVLLHPVSSIMLLVFSSDFAIKVKQKQSAWLSEVCLLSIAKHVHTALNIFDISLLMML